MHDDENRFHQMGDYPRLGRRKSHFGMIFKNRITVHPPICCFFMSTKISQQIGFLQQIGVQQI